MDNEYWTIIGLPHNKGEIMDKDQNSNLLSLIKSLNEFSEERGEIVNEIISIMKSIITRLSALETTVHHIESVLNQIRKIK